MKRCKLTEHLILSNVIRYVLQALDDEILFDFEV